MTGWITDLAHHYGALGVALGAALEGEVAVVTGGALAAHGLFTPVAAALGAFSGSLFADQLVFAIGRLQRQSRFFAWVSAKPAFARGIALIDRHPLLFCLGFRFVYGFRIAGPLAIGASRIPERLFLILNIITAAVWASIFTAIGYRFYPAIRAVLHHVATLQWGQLGVMLLVLAALALTGWWHWQQRARSRPLPAAEHSPADAAAAPTASCTPAPSGSAAQTAPLPPRRDQPAE